MDLPLALTQNAPLDRRRWWRRVRLSVRGLMVLIALVGAGLGLVIQRAQVQRDAVAAVLAAGGSVFYDWQIDEAGIPIRNQKAWAPGWLVQALGPDSFGSVVVVRLGVWTDDEAMAHVGRLDRLQILELPRGRPPITPAGFAHLASLTRLKRLRLARGVSDRLNLAPIRNLHELESLDLQSNALLDSDLAALAGLVRLTNLQLGGNPITDAGLVHLRGLTRLERLSLKGTTITGAGLAILPARLPDLVHLELGRTQVETLAALGEAPKLATLSLRRSSFTDEGLASLERFPGLNELLLDETRVGDDGLAHLQNLPELLRLELASTRVTAQGVRHLATLPQLRMLDLEETDTTDEVVSALITLPKLQVLYMSPKQMTPERLSRLKTARPRIQVIN